MKIDGMACLEMPEGGEVRPISLALGPVHNWQLNCLPGPVNIAARADRCDDSRYMQMSLPVNCLHKIKKLFPFQQRKSWWWWQAERERERTVRGNCKSTHQYCHILRAWYGRLQSANVSTNIISMRTTPLRARRTLLDECDMCVAPPPPAPPAPPPPPVPPLPCRWLCECEWW